MAISRKVGQDARVPFCRSARQNNPVARIAATEKAAPIRISKEGGFSRSGAFRSHPCCLRARTHSRVRETEGADMSLLQPVILLLPQNKRLSSRLFALPLQSPHLIWRSSEASSRMKQVLCGSFRYLRKRLSPRDAFSLFGVFHHWRWNFIEYIFSGLKGHYWK